MNGWMTALQVIVIRIHKMSVVKFFERVLLFHGKGIPRASLQHYVDNRGFPGGTSGKEAACRCRRCRRHGFDPWVRKIYRMRAWQPTPVFMPGESHGQRSQPGGLWSIRSQRIDTTKVTWHVDNRII